MSFNLSSDEEDEDKLEELWKKAANESTYKDSDDEGSDDDNGNAFSYEMAMAPTPTCAAVARLPSGFEFGDDNGEDSDEEDSVSWEDAGQNDDAAMENPDEEDGDKKLPADPKARPLQAVTIDLGSTPKANKDPNKKKKKTKTRRSYRFGSLPGHTQSLLINLHKAHWLALASHVVFNSAQCSTELTLPVAYSLLSLNWTDNSSGPTEPGGYKVPTKEDLKSFCAWYSDLVHKAEERRRVTLRANIAAGAPRQLGIRRSHSKRKHNGASENKATVNRVSSSSRLLKYCSYLASSLAEDPQLLQQDEPSDKEEEWTPSDRVSLFIVMARSMGWRARFVAAIDPIKIDLDLDHPIWMGAMANVFQAVSIWSRTHKTVDKGGNGGDSKPRKRAKRSMKNNECIDLTRSTGMEAGQGMLGWVEVLCRIENGESKRSTRKQSTTGSSKKYLKWIHVDPELEAIDQPNRVEALLSEYVQGNEGKEDSPDMKRKSSRGTSKKRRPVAYVLAAEHLGDSQGKRRVTDVTPRYAASMVETLKLRGIPPKQQAKALSNIKECWWTKAVKELSRPRSSKALNPPPPQSSGKSTEEAIGILSDEAPFNDQDEEEDEDGADIFEKEELAKSTTSETLPTSKDKFKNHPLYVIPSVLKKAEVLAPDAKKRVCGFFKGEMVYSRNDVSEAVAEKKWLYQGRKVKKDELGKPVKRVKARAQSFKGGSFKALGSYGVGKENDGSAEQQRRQLELAETPLNDGMQDLYAIWQTNPWSPPYVGPGDKIPVNEYKNVELELINPGLTHIDEHKIAAVAKQLGIPYAPCLLGFEGHRGNRTPTIRGIVVHEHNAQLLREASVEVVSKSIEDENESRRRAIYGRWKKLLVGVLTKDRLEREYG